MFNYNLKWHIKVIRLVYNVLNNNFNIICLDEEFIYSKIPSREIFFRTKMMILIIKLLFYPISAIIIRNQRTEIILYIGTTCILNILCLLFIQIPVYMYLS